jgi:hypothetical protein
MIAQPAQKFYGQPSGKSEERLKSDGMEPTGEVQAVLLHLPAKSTREQKESQEAWRSQTANKNSRPANMGRLGGVVRWR